MRLFLTDFTPLTRLATTPARLRISAEFTKPLNWTTSLKVSTGTSMVKDPVCGMQVDEKKAGATSAYKGTMYHFCCPACKATFDTIPEKFTGKGATHAGQ